MRKQDLAKALFVFCFVFSIVLSLVVLNKRLHAAEIESEEDCGKNDYVPNEMPWEALSRQFIGSVLFK